MRAEPAAEPLPGWQDGSWLAGWPPSRQPASRHQSAGTGIYRHVVDVR
jgi:hypothetical protein